MGCLSRFLGYSLIFLAMLMVLFLLGHGEMIVGPGLEGATWWWVFLGHTWDEIGIALLVVASGVGLIMLPSRLARREKQRREIQYPKPGPVDDLA